MFIINIVLTKPQGNALQNCSTTTILNLPPMIHLNICSNNLSLQPTEKKSTFIGNK